MSFEYDLGFIGLGVMGEPICGNLARKSEGRVLAFDLDPARAAGLFGDGVDPAETALEVIERARLVFLSLPSGAVVEKLMIDGGLVERLRPGQIVVDLGTSAVDITRRIAALVEAKGAHWADAPVARTRQAAREGKLAVMVGGEADLFETIREPISTFATDITYCGGVGTGQVVKILNNTVLFQNVVALSEARTLGRRAGVAPEVLFDALSKGSADSFALRNHGMKAILPGAFPEGAFPVTYAQKDLRYALDLAAQTGVETRSAAYVDEVFDAAIAAGEGAAYWPVIAKLWERD